MDDPAIVIVGAGYLGQRVVARLGDTASMSLGRSTGLDLDSADSLPVALPASYRVLYTVPPSSLADGDPRLRRLLGLLQPLPERFVYISTTGVYGDCDGAWVNEDSAVHPGTDRAKRRAAAESLLQAWATQNDVHHKILRTPGIYGPGRLGLDRIRTMQALVKAAEAKPGNRIQVDDLVTCCIAAIAGDAPPGVYNVGDGDYRSPTAFSQEVARQAGLPPPLDSKPESARESRRVATDRMRDQLGVTPRYTNATDGIRASLAQG